MAGRVYLFAGGGTGGHLFPGIAVALTLAEREPAARMLFVGSDRPIERDVLAKAPFEHCVLPAISPAEAMRHPLRFLGGALNSRRQAMRLMNADQPSVVIGCGGFASAAPVYAAWRSGVPFVLLEQNVIPGRATRWLSRLGGTVCLSFEQTASHLPRSARTVVTGNPVRREVAGLSPSRSTADEPHRTLLVLGGSQGARSINEHLIGFVRQHAEALADWRIVHQTGLADEGRVQSAYASAQIEAKVAAFFDDMPGLYRQASLVVSRAGATTLAEVACAGLPALLLPYPHAADNHQWHNAIAYHDAGAAVVLDDQPGKLGFANALQPLLKDEECRGTMSAAMRGLAHPDAAARVADVICEAIAP